MNTSEIKRHEQLANTIRRTGRETGATIPNNTVEFLLAGRDDLMTGDLTKAIQTAEQIGLWAGWRMGGRPKFHWPTNARRPDEPSGVFS